MTTTSLCARGVNFCGFHDKSYESKNTFEKNLASYNHNELKDCDVRKRMFYFYI